MNKLDKTRAPGHAGQIIELGERSNSLLNTVKPATANQAQATQVTQATTAQVKQEIQHIMQRQLLLLVMGLLP